MSPSSSSPPRPVQTPLVPMGEPDTVTIEGEVAQIFFTNQENGWTAAVLRHPEGGDDVRVAGPMPGVSVGDPVIVRGTWTTDPKYGRQIRVRSCEMKVPSTEEGIRRYLSSGLVRGIGEELATRLVHAFGARTLDVIEHHPERLHEVAGIGAKRAAAIQAALAGQRGIKEVMVFLQGHGLSPAKAVQVYNQYGDKAVAQIRENPFQLAEDMFGIGPDSPFRIRAGLIYALERAADDGHLYLPEDELVDSAAKLLEVEPALVRDELPLLAASHKVVREQVTGPDGAPIWAIYRTWRHTAEQELAERLRGLTSASAPRLVTRWERDRNRVEKRLGIRLAPAQAKAVEAALCEKVLVITGGPGTGKTTILRVLLEALGPANVTVELAAPTGRAAKRMEEATGTPARTLHRLLEFVPKAGGFQRNAKRPLECDMLIVDEVSMLDVLLARALARALPPPARLLLVGDADQLPSVGPGSVLRQIIESGVIPVVRLTEVFRQAAQSQIVVCAHQVNHGEMIRPPPSNGPGTAPGEVFVVETDDAGRAADLVEKAVCERIPNRYGLNPLSDIQVLCPMRRGRTGTEAMNERLQNALNPGGEQVVRRGEVLRAGDRVMQIRNNYDKEVFNGDLGRVMGLTRGREGRGASRLGVLFDTRLVDYGPEELDQLVLAYACTVHKSQGSEFPAVVMPLLGEHYLLLQRNLLYTALTRARQLFVLVGSPRAIRRAIGNDKMRLRYTALAERLRKADEAPLPH